MLGQAGGVPPKPSLPRSSSSGAGGPPLVEEKVYEYAGDGDVEPNWEGPARPSPMPIVAALEGECEGSRHQKGYEGRERNVGPENRKIERTDRTRSAERGVQPALHTVIG